jgi:signal transduction histidine kinase
MRKYQSKSGTARRTITNEAVGFFLKKTQLVSPIKKQIEKIKALFEAYGEDFPRDTFYDELNYEADKIFYMLFAGLFVWIPYIRYDFELHQFPLFAFSVRSLFSIVSAVLILLKLTKRFKKRPDILFAIMAASLYFLTAIVAATAGRNATTYIGGTSYVWVLPAFVPLPLKVKYPLQISALGIFFIVGMFAGIDFHDYSVLYSISDLLIVFFVTLFLSNMLNAIRYRSWESRQELKKRMAAEVATQRQLNAMKSEFLAELSHELRMPISVIYGFAQYFGEVLDDDPLDRAELRSSARRIENEADRMDRLVGQLLDMAAIEAGRFTLKKEEVSVTALFDQIRKTYFPMMNGGHNRLIINLENDLTIHADRERVLQIFVNLVSNACKYTQDGEIILSGELGVESGELKKSEELGVESGELKKSEELGVENGKLKNAVIFSVADTGEGMSQETLSALFTRYPKMRGGVKGEKGNGLGLFISKKIVEAHGGEIGVESEIGKGTKVWFTIPMEGEHKE